MCGITGFWSRDAPPFDEEEVLRGMVSALRHRGPDDEGHWSDRSNGLHLGHTRLSVIDLSKEGHQPMVSRTGRYVITYNGEVFNYGELRDELGDAGWRGHSDTEVMLEAMERWGVEKAVTRFNGQFALAVWDAEEECLILTRDRIGLKPLYYGQFDGTLLFGSELKACWRHPRFDRQLSPEAVFRFLELGYVPAPLSIFRNVHKLPAGTILRFRSPGSESAPTPYWSLTEIVGRRRLLTAPEEGIRADFESLLRDAVRKRMIADVPIGAFLSGGIDSSLVVALMQQEAGSSVKTFSIGFEDEAFDEAPHATRVAEHLGTDHTNLYVAPQRIFELLSELPRIYDEPFADESQIPTALVSRLARQEVTVSLSGDGGDELFAGYDRYDRVVRHWTRLTRFPDFTRRAAGRVAPAFASMERTAAGRILAASISGLFGDSLPRGQIGRRFDLIGSKDIMDFYRRSVALDARSIAGPALREANLSDAADLESRWPEGLANVELLMLSDALRYLPDDILVKVDRASMDVALEVRVPLLDYRVVEFSWAIPKRMKERDHESKWMIRQILEKYVPRSLFDRPKQGFAVPLHDWLRGPMRDWSESLLDMKLVAETGLLDAGAVNALWRDHLDGRSNAKTMLWRILTLQSWLRSAASEAGKGQAAHAIA